MKFIYYVIKSTNHIYYYVILKRLCIKIEKTEKQVGQQLGVESATINVTC